jgi:ElaB/YqjD/DUF883 family membrane-anchored ribosome-binding protein
MANTPAPTSKQLESEAAAHRARVAATLEELRDRMTAGQLLDQALDYARGAGAGEFVHNLGHQVRQSPFPVALIATGLAWLMLAPRINSPSIVPSAAPEGETAGEAGSRVARSYDSAAEMASSHGRRARQAVSSARESMASAYDAASGALSRTQAAVEDTASGVARAARTTMDRAAGVGQSAAHSAGRAQDAVLSFIREQPMAAGAVGLVLGALLGAALPSTRTENELVGETSDAVKEAAKEAASEQYEQAKEAGRRALQSAQSEAEAQRLSESADDLLQGIGEKVSDIARAAKEGATSAYDERAGGERKASPAEAFEHGGTGRTS